MSGAPSVFVVAVQKELRSRQASPTNRCRSQREGQVADYRAINEVWSLSRNEQKRLAASYVFSIQSRVERERSTKRLTGDCPDDHSREKYCPVSCFPTLLPRQVGRYIQVSFAVSAAVTSSLSLSQHSACKDRGRHADIHQTCRISPSPHFRLQG